MPSTNPLVSVIILNYNGKEFIERCLRSVLSDSYQPREILLVDNASRDDSMALADPFRGQITTILNPDNFGFPKGCNQGIAKASGEFIVLLNIDTEVQSGWLDELIKPLASDPTIAATASKLLFPGGKTIQFAGGFMRPNGLTHHAGYGEDDHGQFDEPGDCDYVTGASVAIRRTVLDELGGLDEGFPLYFEDLDFSFRAKQKGHRIRFQPTSVVWHFETFGTPKHSFKYYYKYHRGRMRFIMKNMGLRYFLFTFLPSEIAWHRSCDFFNQAAPLFCAYATQLPKAPYFWIRGFILRRWQ